MSVLLWVLLFAAVAAAAAYVWTRPSAGSSALSGRPARRVPQPQRAWTDDELRDQLGVSAARPRSASELSPPGGASDGEAEDRGWSAEPAETLRRAPLPSNPSRTAAPTAEGHAADARAASGHAAEPPAPRPASPQAEPAAHAGAARPERPATPPVLDPVPDPPAAPGLAPDDEGRPTQEGGPYVRPDSPLWPAGEAAPRHLIGSLAAQVGGAVAVLRYVPEDDAYAVDALAGLTGGGETRPIPAGDNPLHFAPQDGVLSLLRDDEHAALTYHPDPERSVGQALVRALAEPPAPRVLVVADVPPGAPAVGGSLLDLVGRYVDLLADISDLTPVSDPQLDLYAPPDVDPPRSAEAPSRPPGPASLPKGVILAGEIAAAKEAGRVLAFALVTRADAETILGAGSAPEAEAAAIADAEADLRQRIAGTPHVRRVESFGPLLFGVFLDAGPEAVRSWAAALAASGPPVHVGVVAPAAGDAGAVRSAAKDALQAAYDRSAVCVVA